MKMILIGAGQRGRIYADYIAEKGYAEFAAVVEPDAKRRADAKACLNIPDDFCFTSFDELISRGKIADAAIIATQDKDHYAQAIAALDTGYDLILEKPISPSPRECIEISGKALKLGRKVLVCHVLRYTAFYSQIKAILDSGELGRIMNICLIENIGNFHIAHSFVRGNWSKSAESSPIIVAKSCHDMDLLAWLADSPASNLASYGALRYFRPENAPAGSTERCCDCPVRDDCRFNAYRCYIPALGGWPAGVVTSEATEEALCEALKTSPYGRCVYRCDNDVCDSQIAALQFDNGITATFCMSGFTNRMNRNIRILCEDGEIEGDDGYNEIKVTRFSSNQVEGFYEKVIHVPLPSSGHGGGDSGLVEDFFSKEPLCRTSIDRSIESHLMASAAEQSRLSGKNVNMRDYRDMLSK